MKTQREVRILSELKITHVGSDVLYPDWWKLMCFVWNVQWSLARIFRKRMTSEGVPMFWIKKPCRKCGSFFTYKSELMEFHPFGINKYGETVQYTWKPKIREYLYNCLFCHDSYSVQLERGKK